MVCLQLVIYTAFFVIFFFAAFFWQTQILRQLISFKHDAGDPKRRSPADAIIAHTPKPRSKEGVLID